MMKKTLLSVAVMAMASQASFAEEVMGGEVSASAGVASTYLFRGVDLGGPVVSGGLSWDHSSGAYLSVTGLSGDTANGYEQDYVAGFAKSVGAYDVDVSYGMFNYAGNSAADYDEVALSVTRDAVSVAAVQNLDTDDVYLSASMGVGKVTGTIASQVGDAEYAHAQVDYAATDRVTFSLSKAVDDNAGVDEDAIFMMSYSLPLM